MLGERGFSFAGLSAWNSLPSTLKDKNISFAVFKKLLKTYLFH
jgi:hypothetical protein